MNYLVRVWKEKDGKRETEFHDFSDLDEAKDYAEWKAKQLPKYGYSDFGILIYELTNY